ncbi:MAG TPA: carbohydrate ABC transporter permease [Aggregatilineales bacterium]|nr:carbohydrate ABC transporter permease [Chloroflexota bacterium]HOA22426.1 carbohydrate ABC transporter permease [Aggregatilineales bacterium]HPV06461.1 carbohydrate ABC transporter permease [Aggregatilineales bacterium]HQA68579.1 carbohydrate ABC transporter permease [Aggregatilineales bacterium]HQE17699.1 carbohydrate ABC transporter permease [Aggregatilineales bacterium]
MKRIKLSSIATHVVLLAWSAVVLFPLYTMLINSIKPKREIFRDPYGFPSTVTFEGYQSAWTDGRFDIYFRNSITVTVISLALILLLGSLAAYGLASWRSRVSNLIYLGFVAGLMVPIRLGTINIFQIILALGLNDSIWSLVPVYVAMGLPVATFVMVPFIRALPGDLIDAARVDGASELRIYASVIMPMVRPALATVAIFNLIPIWNDLWFPLIFIRSQQARTVIYGVSLLFGQYQTDWTRILSTLSLSAVPLLILYLLMSKQFIKGLTAGAVKG